MAACGSKKRKAGEEDSPEKRLRKEDGTGRRLKREVTTERANQEEQQVLAPLQETVRRRVGRPKKHPIPKEESDSLQVRMLFRARAASRLQLSFCCSCIGQYRRVVHTINQ